ncbi:MAG: 2-oxo acid dehydrogenase subunit E2 [Anaerolineae bacterium]|nr:2-oxo acid dehydrogenase subunit E2 [Anaerolineae bacterium]
MATAVIMPKLGNTVESSIIVGWKKKPGDVVSEGEALCEIETDKATIDVESPAAGVVLDIFFKEGEDVPVQTIIAVVGAAGENYDALRPAGSAAPAAPPIHTASVPSPAPSQPVNGKAVSPAAPAVPSTTAAAFVGVSPRARNLAEKKELDLSGVQGSGPGGRIIERDVVAALAAKPKLTPLAKSMVESGDFVVLSGGSGPGGRITSRDLQQAAPAPQPQADDVQIIPVKGTRRIISERMLNSMQTTAQLTMNTSADARAVQEYRLRLKSSSAELGLQKVTINDLVLYAVARTLRLFPDVNALFNGESIAQYRSVHLGFAVDTPRGLIVPVIRNAHQLSLKQLSQESKRLADGCLSGKISPDELSGGTFTVTNLGSLGIETFTPILNPPQVAILGVGNINLKAVESEDGVEFIPHLTLSLTINHQVVDGAPGARFLQALSRNLAQVDLLLAV